MKIGILTQPLRENYGGIMQAYALQAVLRKMGHQAWTKDNYIEDTDIKRSWYLRIKNFFYDLIVEKRWTVTDLAAARSFTGPFINSRIKLFISARNHAHETLLQDGFDAYIVGSDQVWRPAYNSRLYDYFLDFTKDANVKRIAYAASFGTDEWEFTPEQTSYCASLLKKFDAVSVREKTAVRLCKEYFGVDATQVLDPTLLLTKEDYLSLIKQHSSRKCEKFSMAYVLNMNLEKYKIMREVSEELQCKGKLNTIRPVIHKRKWKFYKNQYHLSVERWLSQFNQASFVITDSFHGCVFAILFSKPFVAIDNKERGSSRFHSLLDLFDLQDRLVNSYDDFLYKKAKLLSTSINYDKVNSILKTKQDESVRFLKRALTSSLNSK